MKNLSSFKQAVITLDLEGVLIPEIWHRIAEVTGDETFFLTTRDVSDYDQLMALRIAGVQKHGLTLSKIREIIASDIRPFEGALDFFRSLRSVAEVIILSDTFIEFFKVYAPCWSARLFCVMPWK